MRFLKTSVFVVAEDPRAVAVRWARFTGVMPRADGRFVELPLARGRIVIGTRAAMARRLGEAPPPPALAGYALAGAKERCMVTLPAALGGVWAFG